MIHSSVSLADQTKLVEAIVTDSQTGLVVLSALRDGQGQLIDFYFTLVNKAAAQILGGSVEELLGKPFSIHFTTDQHEALANHCRHVLDKGEPVVVREAICETNGLYKWLDLRVTKYGDGVVIAVSDVTPMKQSALQAQQQSRFLDSVLNVSQEAIYVLEAVRQTTDGSVSGPIVDFCYRQVNAAFERLFKAEATQFVGQSYLTLYPTVKATGLFDQFCAVVDTGQPLRLELFYDSEGLKGWYELTVVKLDDGIVGTTRDITHSKQTVWQAQQQLLSLVGNSADFMAVASPEGKLTYLNQAGRDLVGLQADQDVTTMWVEDFYRPADYAQLTGQILPVLWLDGQWSGTVNIRHFQTQALIPCQANFIRIADGETGQPIARGVTLRDLRPERAAQQALLDSEERLKLAIDAASLGTWDYNLVTGDTQWSATYKQLFGLPPDAPVTASRLLERVHPEDREWVNQANARALDPQGDGAHNIIFRTLNDDGRERWVHAKGRTTVDGQGHILRFSGIVFDITELKQIQEALKQSAEVLEHRVAERTQELYEANQQLENSNERLTEFAYVASHDLQEPLRKIQAFGDLLKSGYADQLGEGIDYLQRMQSAAGRMSMLIGDLLSFSRISNRPDMTESVSLTDVVNTTLTDLELTIQDTGAVVTVDPLPTVQGDSSQLGQLFLNLLTNALKFRRSDVRPDIRITTQLVKDTELPPWVKPNQIAATYHLVEISDNGIGFEPRYRDRIFQVFQRLHSRKEFMGTGIGLAICEKVMVNHGGAITADSQPGQGATFSMYFSQ